MHGSTFVNRLFFEPPIERDGGVVGTKHLSRKTVHERFQVLIELRWCELIKNVLVWLLTTHKTNQ